MKHQCGKHRDAGGNDDIIRNLTSLANAISCGKYNDPNVTGIDYVIPVGIKIFAISCNSIRIIWVVLGRSEMRIGIAGQYVAADNEA